jgi:hypothetical protein
MFSELSPEDLARVLPGSWSVRGTNLPGWLDASIHSYSVTFTVTSTEPLTLLEEVSLDVTGAETRRLESIDRLRGLEFMRRSTKKSELLASRWSVSGMSDDESVAVIRFSKTRAVPAGLSVLVRAGTPAEARIRALVAHNTERFGLSLEDFASLAWFGGAH